MKYGKVSGQIVTQLIQREFCQGVKLRGCVTGCSAKKLEEPITIGTFTELLLHGWKKWVGSCTVGVQSVLTQCLVLLCVHSRTSVLFWQSLPSPCVQKVSQKDKHQSRGGKHRSRIRVRIQTPLIVGFRNYCCTCFSNRLKCHLLQVVITMDLQTFRDTPVHLLGRQNYFNKDGCGWGSRVRI